MSKRPASKKSALQCANELWDDAKLEEGDHWFAVSTPWWEDFQVCERVEAAPTVRNDVLIDKQLSLKERKVAVLKPKFEEGQDFVFVPEIAWEAIARELDFDWEICREVIYQRSHQELQIEPYPFVFKIVFWASDAMEPKELVDDAGRAVVVLGSRAYTLGQLLSEVWLAAPEDFRMKFPQFLSSIDPTGSSSSGSDAPIRACYHTRRAADGEMVWTPIEKMLKRPRATTSQVKTRAKKRQARDDEESSEEPSEDDGAESEAEYESKPLKSDHRGVIDTTNTKLGDLRLDNRSEIASGDARLHELLVEQRSQGAAEMGWPSQGLELQWRMNLSKGDVLDALDTSRTWFEARVLTARRNKVHVHYRSWESKWDVWITRTSPQIATPYSKVPRWRSALRPLSLVQVGIQVPRLRHTKWRNATVIEVVPSSDATQGDGDGTGLRVHVQVDYDDIWLPAHDDLLCPSNTHCESKPLTKNERRLLAHDDSVPSDTEVAEVDEQEVDEVDKVDEHEAVEDDDEDGAGLDHHGFSSPPLRPPRAKNAAVEVTSVSCSRMDLRARVGPARDLSTNFCQVQDRGRASPGRTPARRSASRSRVQVSGDDTSPEPTSPAARPTAGNGNSTGELQALWMQVGNDLGELKTSWDQLGESLMVLVQSQMASHPQD